MTTGCVRLIWDKNGKQIGRETEKKRKTIRKTKQRAWLNEQSYGHALFLRELLTKKGGSRFTASIIVKTISE